MANFLRCIEKCNNFERSSFHEFLTHDDRRIGWIHHSSLPYLKRYCDTFQAQENKVFFHSRLNTAQLRSVAIDEVAQVLRQDGIVSGWRDEVYPVTQSFGEVPLLEIERALTPFFGVRAFGVHINGFVRTSKGLKMWIAKRSATKQTSPGMLDNFVAGGQPLGISRTQNVIKECFEEAGVPSRISRQAKRVSSVSYKMVQGATFKPDILFCYDLELPEDFSPQNEDGEVEKFDLYSIDDVVEMLLETDEVKENSALVMIDFLRRHNFINADNCDAYPKIVEGLKQ